MKNDPVGPRRPKVMTTIEVREEVAAFALAMEEKLSQTDHKKHWRHATRTRMFFRLVEETGELAEAMDDGIGQFIRNEAVDVANFAMMIFDITPGAVMLNRGAVLGDVLPDVPPRS